MNTRELRLSKKGGTWSAKMLRPQSAWEPGKMRKPKPWQTNVHYLLNAQLNKNAYTVLTNCDANACSATTEII